MQTFGVLDKLMMYHPQRRNMLIGGTSRQAEVENIKKGLPIVVATPGRLLDHLQNTPDFVYKNLKCLILDEADRILDVGFEEELKQILRILPRK